MRDTGFVLEEQQVARFAANYERQGDGSLKLIDDPEQSSYRKRSFFSGGGGFCAWATPISNTAAPTTARTVRGDT